ncbi:hypothetical protein SCHPADRAFT_890795 [Schizopora paradoxa]|uniref:Uncharacterized protein n=1 Tax=Schizopora paradoxa TaxID=27342 RepID=A0A0H2RLG7_9AGAM|nr:hypothetical protein SCHPADRAFT_890795 [Schizopora paradoxa]
MNGATARQGKANRPAMFLYDDDDDDGDVDGDEESGQHERGDVASVFRLLRAHFSRRWGGCEENVRLWWCLRSHSTVQIVWILCENVWEKAVAKLDFLPPEIMLKIDRNCLTTDSMSPSTFLQHKISMDNVITQCFERFNLVARAGGVNHAATPLRATKIPFLALATDLNNAIGKVVTEYELYVRVI